MSSASNNIILSGHGDGRAEKALMLIVCQCKSQLVTFYFFLSFLSSLELLFTVKTNKSLFTESFEVAAQVTLLYTVSLSNVVRLSAHLIVVVFFSEKIGNGIINRWEVSAIVNPRDIQTAQVTKAI